MRKIYSSIAIMLFLFIQIVPISAEEDLDQNKLEVEPYSTAQYYWWKQDSDKFTVTVSNGSWISHGQPFYASKGQSVCFTPQSTAPTIGIDISLAGRVVAGGISYTPGANTTIATSICDAPFPVNGNYQSQYMKKYAVYSIKQSYYYYEFGTDYLQYSKTGTLKVNTTPTYRHVKK